MTSEGNASPTRYIADGLRKRNRFAQELIDSYATKHALMDIGVGFAGLVPGLAIPAMITSVGMQVPVIYKPLAKELAYIYLAEPRALRSISSISSLSPYLVSEGLLQYAVYIGQEFGVEFIKEIAGELIAEVGAGTIASTFIPVFGAVAAAGLDYYIANKMTRCVGRMVAIYFQNHMRWNIDRQATFETAKNFDGSLDDLRRIPYVEDSLARNVRMDIENMRSVEVDDSKIRANLRDREVPEDVIEAAFRSAGL